MGKYFGTDGIRGEANITLTASLAFRAGQAMVLLGSDTVVIGNDTRISKDMLSRAFGAGVMSKGLNVIYADIVPTPCLIYYSEVKQIAGVMITASHNPYTDNGIKILLKGRKLTEEQEKEIEDYIDNPNDDPSPLGKVIPGIDIERIYMDMLKNYMDKSELKVAIDCANGATYLSAPKAFRFSTKKVFVIANEPDGVNINTGVGSTHIEYLQKKVVDNKCDVGFAFDGDGDRVLAADREGNVYNGDMLIYVIAKYLKEKDVLKKNHVVLTVMSNLGIINALKRLGIEVSLTPVGDKNVVNELLNNGYIVGGEASGHIVLPDLLRTGDGTLVGLIIIRIMERTKKTLKELTKDVSLYPDKTVNIRVRNKKEIMTNDGLINRINEIRNELGDSGKIVVRASGTEELIRITVSAENEEILNRYLNEVVSMVEYLKEE